MGKTYLATVEYCGHCDGTGIVTKRSHDCWGKIEYNDYPCTECHNGIRVIAIIGEENE